MTLVSPARHTPYSGMLPGCLEGVYSVADCHIDLAALCAAAGARLVVGEAAGVDPAARSVLLASGQALGYDVLSINTGAGPGTGGVPGAAEHATPVKPVAGLLSRVDSLLTMVAGGGCAAGDAVVVVGGGAGGVEVAAALAARFGAHAASGVTVPRVILVAGPALLPAAPKRAAAMVRRRLDMAGVAVLEARAVCVEAREGGGVAVCLDRPTTSFPLLPPASPAARCLPALACLWCTAASPPTWLARSGLPVDAGGWLAVDEACACGPSGPLARVFAAGDVAAVRGHPRPKAGVWAVRAGAPLAENLRRAAAGRAMQQWRPQRDALAILGLGAGRAPAN